MPLDNKYDSSKQLEDADSVKHHVDDTRSDKAETDERRPDSRAFL